MRDIYFLLKIIVDMPSFIQVDKLTVGIVGTKGSGKSSLISRFVRSDGRSGSIETIYVRRLRTVHKIRMVEWDRMETIRELCRFRGAILMFDCTSIESFNDIKKMAEYTSFCIGNTTTVALVCNKTDSNDRCVSEEAGVALAKEYGISYMEISATTGSNVDILFDRLIDSMCQKAYFVDRECCER